VAEGCANLPEKQQKNKVRPATVRKYPAENLENAQACSYSFLSPLDKSATPFPLQGKIRVKIPI
jgi:hypothetical protein